MPNRIDYTFISKREGGDVTTAYVPDPQLSDSGVTVAMGFDLGRRDESDLHTLKLSPAVAQKPKPYLGLRRAAASSFLKQCPLAITAAEANEIDAAVSRAAIRLLRMRYRVASSNVRMTDFFNLPRQAQTVIASVSFQYGNLALRTPNFWKAVTAQDWKRAIAILRKFGDRYPSRRNAEANLLEGLIQ